MLLVSAFEDCQPHRDLPPPGYAGLGLPYYGLPLAAPAAAEETAEE